jgi:hypothetical protein
MAVMDYSKLGHNHDEFPHVQSKNIRGQNRKGNRRKTKREVKRFDQHKAAKEIKAGLLEWAHE